jgi:hypothetical protein
MLGSASRIGIKVDQEPHSQSTVGTAAPAVAAVAYTLSASLMPLLLWFGAYGCVLVFCRCVVLWWCLRR